MPTIRIIIIIFCLPVFCGFTSDYTVLSQGEWAQYKRNYMLDNGSIKDTSNDNVRHTEGQGFGMLLAQAYNDQDSFQKMWLWTKNNLQVRKVDKLFAWKWQEQKPHITDYNNATDGDIFIAWALLRAYETWGDENHKQEALNILNDIKALLITKQRGKLLLLPGISGFKKLDGTILNLSYLVFPAFPLFQKYQPEDKVWSRLMKHGLELVEKASFGTWHMPPDWLMHYGGKLAPAEGFPKRFGLDAVRIPLYLIWSGNINHETVHRSNHFWNIFSGFGAYPDWLSLEDTVVHLAANNKGVMAIASLATQCINDVNPNSTNPTPLFPTLGKEKLEYYHASLILLSKVAWLECRLSE